LHIVLVDGLRIMNRAKLIVIAISVTTGLLALIFVGSSAPPAPPPVDPSTLAAPIETEDVLVASRDLAIGTVTVESDFQWVRWPRDAVSVEAMLTNALNPNIIEDIRGSIVRNPLMRGEPIRREKLVKGQSSGMMSAILPSGMRAVAVPIDKDSTLAAGGFILPNDRVDVVRSSQRSDRSQEFEVETILADVRILAVGQTSVDRGGERNISAVNATLEVTPAQAEILVLAQRQGPVSLILRSILDAGQDNSANVIEKDLGISIIRYGVTQYVGKK
jgi:pilus assembly protein CpaB